MNNETYWNPALLDKQKRFRPAGKILEENINRAKYFKEVEEIRVQMLHEVQEERLVKVLVKNETLMFNRRNEILENMTKWPEFKAKRAVAIKAYYKLRHK